MAVWTQEERFLQLFKRVFDHSPKGKEMGVRLLALKQGNLSAAEYAHSFRTIAAGSSWNEPTLKATYRQGLNKELLTEMMC